MEPSVDSNGLIRSKEDGQKEATQTCRSKLLEIKSKGPGSVKDLVHFFSTKVNEGDSIIDTSEMSPISMSTKSLSTNNSPRTSRDIISNNRNENNFIARKYREMAKTKLLQEQALAAENRKIAEVIRCTLLLNVTELMV